MMIPWKVSTFSEFICSAFQFQGHLAQNKSVNAWKIANDVRKGWKLMTWLWMVHTERKKVWKNEVSAFVTDEFSSEPWYFERDSPFYTRSASSFCRNPLNFLAHAMWVKWLYHANFQPFQRSFVVLVSFHGHLAQKYEWMPEKDQMKSERVENCWCGFEWWILNTKN